MTNGISTRSVRDHQSRKLALRERLLDVVNVHDAEQPPLLVADVQEEAPGAQKRGHDLGQRRRARDHDDVAPHDVGDLHRRQRGGRRSFLPDDPRRAHALDVDRLLLEDASHRHGRHRDRHHRQQDGRVLRQLEDHDHGRSGPRTPARSPPSRAGRIRRRSVHAPEDDVASLRLSPRRPAPISAKAEDAATPRSRSSRRSPPPSRRRAEQKSAVGLPCRIRWSLRNRCLTPRAERSPRAEMAPRSAS